MAERFFTRLGVFPGVKNGVVESFFDFCIKILANSLALDGVVSMLNPVIKSTSEYPEHLSHTHYTEAQQVFEHKLVVIYFRFFAK
ncbi:hypothetical protein BOO93_17445 [Vibrio navarrensis]|nr:hypothetical protein [Vibrio navarrensis]